MTAVTPVPSPDRPGLAHRLYHGETAYDFVNKRRVGFAISGVLILVGLLSLLVRDLNMGIEFDGGVAWEVPGQSVSVDDVRSVMDAAGLGGAKIQMLSRGGADRTIRVQVGPQDTATQQEVQKDLADLAGVELDDVSLTSVGPSWGDEITRKAVRALIVFFIVITLYITLRFEWRMAIGALAAVVHDVLISVGIYSVFGFEVTPATVVAFLTILGFSLYDTIVVFDKVHENSRKLLGGGRVTYGDVVNVSMNQVLMRSINTSLAALLPVLSLLVVGSWLMGAVALKDFALALFVGLLTGSYSSIFVATPILAMLKEREPKHRATMERVGARTTGLTAAQANAVLKPSSTGMRPTARRGAVAPGAGSGAPTAAGAVPDGAAPGAGHGPGTPTGTGAPADLGLGSALGHPPRPRKKKRR